MRIVQLTPGTLLRLAASRAAMTRATDLGDLTLSMLSGGDGRQGKELEKVVAWFAAQRPDVVSLSNLLLIGMARRIREALGVPVVCALQGEESFVDALPNAAACWQALRDRARDVSTFVAVSDYYRHRMRERLDLPQERVLTIHNGIALDGFAPSGPPSTSAPSIGYLARMHPSKGLDLLVTAFIQLHRRGNFPDAILRVAGNCLPSDVPFVSTLKQRLREAGCDRRVEFFPNLDRSEKQAFLRTLTLFTVPAPREAFGLYLLEALAAGVPVVQPDEGAFPELIASTGGGVLCPPGDPDALAAAWENILVNRPRLAELGRCGALAVRERFTSETMARAFAAVCEKTLSAR